MPSNEPPLVPSFFFQPSVHRQHLHSFPTRRSSDQLPKRLLIYAFGAALGGPGVLAETRLLAQQSRIPRSEEHTSELQSPMYLVCRLLLEKKKQRSRWLDKRTPEIGPRCCSGRERIT